GLLGTASTLALLLALSLEFCCDARLHLFPKVLQPVFCQRGGFPGRFREKAAQSCQTGSSANLTQQVAQGSSSFTLHQPQQHGHEVLVLGLGEQVLEPLAKVAHLFIQTYNGNWHGTPPWSQELFFFCLI